MAIYRLGLPVFPFGLCVAILLGSLTSPLFAIQKFDPLKVLPETTVILVEVAPSSEWIEHPLRKQVERTEPFRAIWNSPEVLKARGGITLAEFALGDRLESVVRKLAREGMEVAVDGETGGVVLLAHSESKAWLAEYLEKFLNLARGDTKSKSLPDPIKSAEYRGLRGYEVNQGIVVAIENTLLVTNKSELAKRIIDRFQDNAQDGIGTVNSFREHRLQSKKSENTFAWGYLDVDALRKRGVANELLGGRAKDFGAELILGGLFSTLEHTPRITASLVAKDDQILLQLRSPHEATWRENKREFFFGPEGKGAASPMIQVADTLGSLSAYRNVSKLWMMAGDLFDQRVNDQLAQADNTLTTLFSGRDFGSDILGALHPQLRMIVAQQVPTEGQPTPAIRLPAFALIAQLKDPKIMKPELKRIFQSLVGFLNVTGAQNGQPQLDLNMESIGDAQFVLAHYVAEVDRKEAKVVPIQYNFSPCLAFTGEQAILASTDTLAKQIVEQCRKQSDPASIKTTSQNTLLELESHAIRQALEMNKGHLISQNMLEKGHSKKEAEGEIGMLLKILALFDKGSLSLDYSQERQAELQLGLKFHVQDK